MTVQADSIVSKSSATESVRSPVSNLSSVCDGIQCDEICDVIAHYLQVKHGIAEGKVSCYA